MVNELYRRKVLLKIDGVEKNVFIVATQENNGFGVFMADNADAYKLLRYFQVRERAIEKAVKICETQQISNDGE